MKTIQCLVWAATAVAAINLHAEEWRRLAFIGGAEAKHVTGLVEVVEDGEERVMRPGEKAEAGQTLRIWRGAEVVLVMDSSKGLVRAKGPVLLRLAPEVETHDRAAIKGPVYEVRAVRGHGKYEHEGRWLPIKTGMTLPEGASVRPFRNTTLDFYHTGARAALRITDHTKKTVLSPKSTVEAAPAILAAKAP